MQSITFECEVITPMFLAGADGTTPELRAPSIKGALRFWWRAMNGHLSLEDLKKRETEIFGGTSGDSGQKSSFIIRISEQPKMEALTKETWKNAKYEVRESQKTGKPYFAAKKNGSSFDGFGYLFYSTWLDGEKPKEAIKEGEKFQVTLGFTSNQSIEAILNALYLTTLFGGLGSRTRRGAGGFKVSNVIACNDSYLEARFKSRFTTKVDSVEDLESLFKLISIEPNTNSLYSHLSESFVYLFEKEKTWESALEKIGKPFKTFRDIEKGNIKDTPNFGFPIVHRSSKTTMQAGRWIEERGRKELIKLERRSSPLIFKIFKNNKNEYFPFILWLNGELIPKDFEIMDKDGRNNLESSFGIVDDFINELNYETKITL